MNLNEIKNPKFLKSMSLKDMDSLANDIRKFLIHSVAKTGGHLASNLGVVELTIALHYVFDSPKDKIFFDVGHQCYTHKILTGRAKDFDQLRQYDGLSGFQKRKESEHDVWEAGHSSTSLSAALGMAIARDLDGEHYQVIPVIGDGALSSGMSLEALNQIGAEQKNMIIVFNDNNMSISRNVGALSNGFSQLRSSASYMRMKNNLKRNLMTSNLGEAVYSSLKQVKNAIKDSIVDRGIFGQFNLDYIGPIDGDNIRELIQVFEAVKDHDGPIVVHVMTKKGKGYLPCENDKEGKWHGVGPFDITTGKMLHSAPVGCMTWAECMSESVRLEAEDNKDIIAISPAMVTGSHLQKFFAEFPKRSFDTGIAEEHAATFAAGLAISGKRPYLAIYSSFLQRCYDQINHDICRMDLPVVIGVDHAGLVGSDGETHHGIFDIGILEPIPNLIFAQPADSQEVRDLIYTAFHQEHPFAIRYPKGFVNVANIKKGQMLPIGSWVKYHDDPSHKVSILTYGDDVMKIVSKVQVNQLPVTVINCRFFKPVDEEMLQELAKRHMTCIVYEVDMKIGGLGEHLLGYLNDQNLEIPMHILGLPDEYMQQGSERLLRKDAKVDINTLMNEIEKYL